MQATELLRTGYPTYVKCNFQKVKKKHTEEKARPAKIAKKKISPLVRN